MVVFNLLIEIKILTYKLYYNQLNVESNQENKYWVALTEARFWLLQESMPTLDHLFIVIKIVPRKYFPWGFMYGF